MKHKNLPTMGPKKIAKRLASYSAAAAATAVATQGTANAAEVVWDITDMAFSGLGVNFNPVTGAHGAATASIDNAAAFRVGTFPNFFDDDLAIQGPAGSAGVAFVGTPLIGDTYAYANLLAPSATLGPAGPFAGNNAYLGSYGVYAFMDAFVGERGIVGFQFDIGGNTHFGWADITGAAGPTPGDANNATGPVGILHAFGYNDAVGTATHPIPEPSSILLLAVGAAGLGMRRRRKTA